MYKNNPNDEITKAMIDSFFENLNSRLQYTGNKFWRQLLTGVAHNYAILEYLLQKMKIAVKK